MRASFFISASLAISVPANSAPLQPLSTLCQRAGMTAYPAVNVGLQAGSLYTYSKNGPSLATVLCPDALAGADGIDKYRVSGELPGQSGDGNIKSSTSFGLSLLSGLLGKDKSAELKAGIDKGDTWTVSLGEVRQEGISQTGVMRLKLTKSNCLKDLALMVPKGGIKTTLIYQTAVTDNVYYKASNNKTPSGSLGVNIANLLTIGAQGKTEKVANDELKATGKKYNVCYAAQTGRIKPSGLSSEGIYSFTPEK